MGNRKRTWQALAFTLATLAAMTIGPLLLMAGAAQPSSEANSEGASGDTSGGSVRVATLVYEDGKTSECFAPGFLTTAARHTKIEVDRQFASVALGKDDLHDHPFVIMTGDGDFTLPEAQKAALKAYIRRGGFVLASSSCSSEQWTASFRALMKEIFPDQPLEVLAMDHPVFRTIYDLRELPGRKSGTRGVLEGLTLDGRLAVIFSAMGLNDTQNAGGGCCCCGGNELREAHRINANVLAYVLTH